MEWKFECLHFFSFIFASCRLCRLSADRPWWSSHRTPRPNFSPDLMASCNNRLYPQDPSPSWWMSLLLSRDSFHLLSMCIVHLSWGHTQQAAQKSTMICPAQSVQITLMTMLMTTVALHEVIKGVTCQIWTCQPWVVTQRGRLWPSQHHKLIFNISRLGNPASSCEVMATREEGNQQTINVLRCYVDNKKKIQTNVDVFKCHLMTIDYTAMTSRKRIPGLHPPAWERHSMVACTFNFNPSTCPKANS